jgi:glycosyltransferase involved in cell wall biosynthesis
MRIAQVAPPVESVPPAGYGGTERVISTLTEELVRRGHDVTLFASGDSRTSARLLPVTERALWHVEGEQDFTPAWIVVLGKVLREVGGFDIVHSHLDYFGFPLARRTACPLVTTLHGRLDIAELGAIFREFDDVPLVSISDAQRRPVPYANWVATVHHGIDLPNFALGPGAGGYLAFLGRISPEKGVDTAIRVARRAGMPIKIAARMPLRFERDPVSRRDRAYYQDAVAPCLGGPDVELVGEVAGQDKSRFLGDAAALLFPISWPEPFGLVMPEALACGTPVLAFRQGSVPEVLRDGETGFICDSEDELVDAVGRLDRLDRRRCRTEAEQRFSPAAMAAQYERVYEGLVRRPNSTA